MTTHKTQQPADIRFSLQDLFTEPATAETGFTLESGRFRRVHHDIPGKAALILDSFPDVENACCCFLRLPAGEARTVRFTAPGVEAIESCPAGGWLLRPADSSMPCYWIPQLPLARSLDSQQRILSEKTVTIAGFGASAEELSIELETPAGMGLDWVIWRLPAGASGPAAELDQLLTLETQPLSLWNSQTRYRSPADLYLYLVHGHVYVDRFIWPRMWKICSELDAYGLYIIMSGLETATGKLFYGLLKRQLLYSIIARQAEDGGWYHGEWTDLMESHYRFHNGAMLLLEAALKEQADEVAARSLERAAEFISRHTDQTDLGLWFLHDSLEEDADMMRELCRQTGSTWIPARTLGKSPTNKLILNTHLDTIVALEHYRRITGDDRYREAVESALAAARGVLALRPAEAVYRFVYRLIGLTLLPTPEAERLPVFLRAIKRLTWKYLTPNLYRLKNIFPRLVMPDGLIERHLAMPHYDINYHPVNVMDLTRLWRCFPDEDLAGLLEDAVKAVSDSSLLEYWAEAKQRHFSLVVWVEALYQLCTLRQDTVYRRLLAEGMLKLLDNRLGLPPSLLGADPEAVEPSQRIPCPSPLDSRVRVANLRYGERREILVVNATDAALDLVWEDDALPALTWSDAGGRTLPEGKPPPVVDPGSWIRGYQA
jgi:hypothetical protein